MAQKPQKNFAITGVAGYIAPRHLKAIKATGSRLVAALDPRDSVGILDQFSFDVRYFPEFERFDRYLDKLLREQSPKKIDFLSICSPNYLHDAHCRLGLRLGADVLCEKPLVISPWNLDALAEIEEETGRNIFTVLQLRVHPTLLALKQRLKKQRGKRHQVVLSYITARGPWYQYSWKGEPEKSGGVATNIGIHFFDLLLWLFGKEQGMSVQRSDALSMSGTFELERADVQWFLSVNHQHLPFKPKPGEQTTYRSIEVDGEEVEFTEGFADLHTEIYTRTIKGEGFGLAEARGGIELVHKLRQLPIRRVNRDSHPLARKLR